MPEKDPTTYSLITYGWVLLLSMWGGIVSFIQKVRSGETRPTNIMEFVGELVTCGFVGVITFWSCEAAGFSGLWTAISVAITAHMGTRAIYQLEKQVAKRLGFSKE